MVLRPQKHRQGRQLGDRVGRRRRLRWMEAVPSNRGIPGRYCRVCRDLVHPLCRRRRARLRHRLGDPPGWDQRPARQPELVCCCRAAVRSAGPGGVDGSKTKWGWRSGTLCGAGGGVVGALRDGLLLRPLYGTSLGRALLRLHQRSLAGRAWAHGSGVGPVAPRSRTRTAPSALLDLRPVRTRTSRKRLVANARSRRREWRPVRPSARGSGGQPGDGCVHHYPTIVVR